MLRSYIFVWHWWKSKNLKYHKSYNMVHQCVWISLMRRLTWLRHEMAEHGQIWPPTWSSKKKTHQANQPPTPTHLRKLKHQTKPRHMKTWASAEKHSHLWPAHWWRKSPSEMTEFELNHSARWWHGSWRMAAWTNTKEIVKRNCKYYTQIILNNHN